MFSLNAEETENNLTSFCLYVFHEAEIGTSDNPMPMYLGSSCVLHCMDKNKIEVKGSYYNKMCTGGKMSLKEKD